LLWFTIPKEFFSQYFLVRFFDVYIFLFSWLQVQVEKICFNSMDVEALKKMKKNKKAIIKHIPHIAGPCLIGQASALFCYIYII
jgi:hypothetical protein